MCRSFTGNAANRAGRTRCISRFYGCGNARLLDTTKLEEVLLCDRDVL
jgi:hypothetical protein